ncbi:YkyA family protein [Lentibacillus saliphilus]|uniref:YkyA family protein n=1 Tax=Lentibacillus saliphilus TaxID=2737028 RepID=UPI0031BA5718
MPFKRTVLLLTFIMIGVLSACTGASTTEQIYDHLEKTVELEAGFEEQQEPIIALERQEQAIYKQIIEIGMEDFDKIKSLADEAIDLIDKRREKIELEKESIEKAKEEFSKVEALIDDIDDEGVKSKAQNMHEIMTERFSAYNDLYDAYTASLDQEEQLYKLLKKEDLEQDQLTEQINNVNKSYEEILTANDAFNEYTVEYNTLKTAFYEAAGIDVQQEEDNNNE